MNNFTRISTHFILSGMLRRCCSQSKRYVHKFNKPLHQRVITEEEKVIDGTRRNNDEELPPEDKFGTLPGNIKFSKRKSSSRKFNKPLHQRVLTEQVRIVDGNGRNNDDELPLKDQFGTLSGSLNQFSTHKSSSRKFDKPLHQRVLTEPERIVDGNGRNNDDELPLEDQFGTLSGNRNQFSTCKASSRRNADNVASKKNTRSESMAHSEDWTETFGTITRSGAVQHSQRTTLSKTDTDFVAQDEDDEEQQIYRSLAPFRKHTPAHYGRKIEQLAKQGKIYEAIEVLETEMLKEVRVMPDKFVFTVLITYLGRVGYTKKAFQLYIKMKKLGIPCVPATYTALFNACANSPSPSDGLERAAKLRMQLLETEHEFNRTNYNAMIKAFGKCGDLLTAFAIVDEMGGKMVLEDYTIAALLMACVSDKEAGLRHAIEVWRRMRKRKMTPTIHLYNLLLRVIRDCKLGEPELINQLLGQRSESESGVTVEARKLSTNGIIPPYSVQQDDSSETDNLTVNLADQSSSELISATHKTGVLTTDLADLTSQPVSVIATFIPNILNPRARNLAKAGVQLNPAALNFPSKRFEMFGGVAGMLGHMAADKVKPDVKTFGLMLNLIPYYDGNAEFDLIAAMEVHGVELQTDFLNLIIRRRTRRRDQDGVKAILSLMATKSLSPNIMTFGCLATGCETKEEGVELLTSMADAGIFPTLVIYRTLLFQSKNNFYYKIEILKSMKQNEVDPDEDFLNMIEDEVDKARNIVIDKEHGRDVDLYYHSKTFTEGFKKFRLYYKQWLSSRKVENEPHPWEQYQKPSVPEEVDGENWKAPRMEPVIRTA